LEGQKFPALLLVLFHFQKEAQFARQLLPVIVQFGKLVAQLPQFSEGIKKIKMAPGDQELLMIMLGGDIDKIFRQISNQTGGNQSIIDIKSAAPIAMENPPDNTFAILCYFLFIQQMNNLGMMLRKRE
jgi:hypothetical protein